MEFLKLVCAAGFFGFGGGWLFYFGRMGGDKPRAAAIISDTNRALYCALLACVCLLGLIAK